LLTGLKVNNAGRKSLTNDFKDIPVIIEKSTQVGMSYHSNFRKLSVIASQYGEAIFNSNMAVFLDLKTIPAK